MQRKERRNKQGKFMRIKLLPRVKWKRRWVRRGIRMMMIMMI
jgi:hypothetical protein